jgi:dUTP pyrophosphatase
VIFVKIKFKRLHPDAILPEYAHDGDSGFDLYSVEDIIIPSGIVKGVRTGLAVELPSPVLVASVFPAEYIQTTFELQIRPKSGLALKGLSVFNTPGTIDNGYRGELIVLLYSIYGLPHEIFKGDKIAQAVLVPVLSSPFIEITEVDSLGDTVRGNKGFGSTGFRRTEVTTRQLPPAKAS